MNQEEQSVDISVQGGGSVFLFVPESEAGRQFLAEAVNAEPWQWLGQALAVDHHYAGDLAEACMRHGLTVR
ncbi:MAG TPA: hypothetical protein VFO27_00035 [Bryobacteraceae bacterium]|nr:hypothetical protein [Bryobacteraceae bacterium]